MLIAMENLLDLADMTDIIYFTDIMDLTDIMDSGGGDDQKDWWWFTDPLQDNKIWCQYMFIMTDLEDNTWS